MAAPKRKTMYKKIALALSLCMLILWSLLGTGASLAWFADTSEDIRNIFHFGSLSLTLNIRQPDGTYAPVDGQEAIFDDDALYEPGYVQVVYLRLDNTGTCDFTYNTAVNVTDYTVGIDYFGQPLVLQKYLRFGMITADTEAELLAQLSSRAQAKALAVEPLNNYSSQSPDALKEGKSCYMALIVYMPETVGNEANYRGNTVPTVELGIIFKANQLEN